MQSNFVPCWSRPHDTIVRRLGIFIFVVLSFLSSCASNKFLNSGYGVGDEHNYYINDSLGIYIKSPGDYFLLEQYFSTRELLTGMRKLNKGERHTILYNFKSPSNSRVKTIVYLLDDDFAFPPKYSKINQGSFPIYQYTYANKNKKYVESIIELDSFRLLFKREIDQNQVRDSKNYFWNDEVLESKPNIESSIAKAFRIFNENNNYFTYRKLIDFEKNYSDSKALYYQIVLTFAALAHDFEVVDEFERRWKGSENKKIDLNDSLQSVDGIFETLENERVVILNEAHHIVNHRIFAQRLLRRLKQNGFTHLAVEALFNDGIYELEGIDHSIGIYTKEPHFANLLRKAKQMNFEIIHYDARGKKRDSIAANNIFEKTFKNNPNAKVFVYVGYDHANEDSTKNWLANQFNKQFNIDPLTIEQSRSRDFINEKTPLGVFLRPKVEGDIQSDFYVVNNIQIFNNSRSISLDENPLKSCAINFKNLNPKVFREGRSLVLEIYPENEFINNENIVPAFIKVMSSYSKNLEFNYSQPYLLRIKDSSGYEVFSMQLSL